MTENLSAVDELFSSSEFGQLFINMKKARDSLSLRNRRLRDYVANEYGCSEIAEHDVDCIVSIIVNQPDENLKEKYEDDNIAQRLIASRGDARIKESQTTESIIKLGEDSAISQFALYGLKQNVMNLNVTKKSLLKKQVVESENDFELIDKLVRNNPGRLLTVINLAIYVCKLGEGGISLEDGIPSENTNIVFPVPKSTKSYIALASGESEIYEDDSMYVSAYGARGVSTGKYTNVFDNWTDALSGDNSFSTLGFKHSTFVVGDLCDENPQAPEANDKYYREVFDRAHELGSAVITGWHRYRYN